ncbi:MAG: hypothetical protein COC05_03290, partial [Gammaproteobacteria bacterium]
MPYFKHIFPLQSMLGLLILIIAAPGVQAGILTGQSVVSPTTIDLTSEGSRDWIQFGLDSVAIPNRKANTSALLGNVTALGGANFRRAVAAPGVRADFSWTDGSPTLSATTGNRIFTTDIGSGFEMTIPVGTDLQTLHFYVGGFRSQGLFQASLSDNSAAPFSVTVANLSGPYDQRVSLDVQADSPNQTLSVQFVHTGGTSIAFIAASAPGIAGNLLPTANNGTLSVDFDTITGGSLGANDPDSDPLTFSINSQPSQGAITLNNATTGSFTYTPNVGATGLDSFTFIANDGNGNSNVATVSITIASPVSGGGTGILTGQSVVSPTTIDLTSEGNRDWIQFGLDSVAIPNRKANTSALLGNVTALGGANFRRAVAAPGVRADFSWTDGSPTLGATTGNRIFTTDIGSGFEMTIPVGTDLQTLHFYVGGFRSQGLFQASLSDNSAAPFSVTVANLSGPYDQRVSLDVQADSPNQTLSVQFVHTGGTSIAFIAASAPGIAGNLL